MEENKMIGVPEFAKKYHLDDEKVRRWCRSGKLLGAEQDGKWKPWHIPIDAVPPQKRVKNKHLIKQLKKGETIRKRFISCLLAVVFLLTLSMPFALATDERKSGLFSYTMKGNGSAIIVGFDAVANGNNDIYVPSQIDGYTVSEIGTEAFKYVKCECVVMLPDTITTIGEEAFYGSSFTMVNIPASVKEIKTDAFSHMANIKKMTVDSQNTVYATIDGVLYNKQTKTLVACPYNDRWSRSSSEISITIPNGILTIGEGAFSDFDKLTINMPASLLTISDRAFEKAELGEVSIPKAVELIGEKSFYFSYFYMMRNGETVLYLPASIKK